jgi:hypothetical protein
VSPVTIDGTGKYGRSRCFLCLKMVTNCGLGYVSHMRSHVRRGDAVEKWSENGNFRIFLSTTLRGKRL